MGREGEVWLKLSSPAGECGAAPNSFATFGDENIPSHLNLTNSDLHSTEFNFDETMAQGQIKKSKVGAPKL